MILKSGVGVRLCDLPNEILDGILGFALQVPFDLFDHPLPSPFDANSPQHTSSFRILEVCKPFRDLGHRHLYETVIIRSKAQVISLLSTLQKETGDPTSRTRASKGLRKMIKKVRVEDALRSPISELLQLCESATHLWVDVRGGQGMEKGLECMNLVHITIWNVELAQVNSVLPTARDKVVLALCTMIRCSETLVCPPTQSEVKALIDMQVSLRYHRARESSSHSTQVLSAILASTSLPTVTLPSRPLQSEPDRDLNLFGLFLKMKGLVQLQIEADHYPAEHFYSRIQNCHPSLLKRLAVLFGPRSGFTSGFIPCVGLILQSHSDLDASSHIPLFSLKRFDQSRRQGDERGASQFTVLQLLIHWYTFGSESNKLQDLSRLSVIYQGSALSTTDPGHVNAPEIKADYHAFSGFLRVHLAKLKWMRWETDGDPFREGTASAVASGLEDRLPMLEFLEYSSSDRHFLDTLCAMR